MWLLLVVPPARCLVAGTAKYTWIVLSRGAERFYALAVLSLGGVCMLWMYGQQLMQLAEAGAWQCCAAVRHAAAKPRSHALAQAS